MDKLVSIRIDVNQIDKARLFAGAKGTYLDIVGVLKEEKDQYGNSGFVTQQTTQEERQLGLKMPILGNMKVLSVMNGAAAAPNLPKAPAAPAAMPNAGTPAPIADDDLPF